jgi:hypothetical protein
VIINNTFNGNTVMEGSILPSDEGACSMHFGDHVDPTVVNSVMNSSTGVAMYLGRLGVASVRYCDFFDNGEGNFLGEGIPPPGLGDRDLPLDPDGLADFTERLCLICDDDFPDVIVFDLCDVGFPDSDWRPMKGLLRLFARSVGARLSTVSVQGRSRAILIVCRCGRKARPACS